MYKKKHRFMQYQILKEQFLEILIHLLILLYVQFLFLRTWRKLETVNVQSELRLLLSINKYSGSTIYNCYLTHTGYCLYCWPVYQETGGILY